MLLLAIQCVVFAAIFVGCSALTSIVIEPIKSSGDEVGLILVPGAFIEAEAYRKTAEAIQQASDLRVWVALTGNYLLGVPNPLQLNRAVKGAIRSLETAGMTSSNYVGVAHSLGGVFLSPYARRSPLKAIVLMGSYINRATKLRDYPKPVLTLSAELDGQTRITRIALDYEQLQRDAKENKTALYRTPVVSIKGSSHAQFASGRMPLEVRKFDLPPDISEQEAHIEIGRYVSHFLAVTFSSKDSEVEDAKRELENDFDEAGKLFQPLLDVKALDVAGSESPWAKMAQARFAGNMASKTAVKNKIMKRARFLLSKPSISRLDSGIVIETSTRIDYEWNPADIATNMESPKEVDIKMKSTDAILEVLGSAQESKSQPEETCRSLNEWALEIALTNSTTQAQARYRQRGRPIMFKDDIVLKTGIHWSTKSPKLREDDDGLHIQAVSLFTSTSKLLFPGMHYCKIISPYRAMEWINVDSLRSQKP